MFLSCGLVSKNHMLLNLPGILIPQNANHLLPGLFLCQLKSLNSDSKMRGPTRGLFGLRTVAQLSCLWPIAPSLRCPQKSLSWISRLPILVKERDVVERAEEAAFCSQLTFTHSLCNTNSVFFGPFLTDGPLLRRIIVFQTFLALRLLR